MSAQPKFNMVAFAGKAAGFEPESQRDKERFGDEPKRPYPGVTITFTQVPSQDVIDGILKNHRETYEFLKKGKLTKADEDWWQFYVQEFNRRLKGEK